MIQLSVNVNKIATLRNSRGGDIPNLLEYSEIILNSGVAGLTVHPREDGRHINRHDVSVLKGLIDSFNQKNTKNIEYNIEGEPSERFLSIVLEERPTQATLVPVQPGEITSHKGFQLKQDYKILEPIVNKIKSAGIRVAVFVEAGVKNLDLAKQLGVDRIELYTGPFAFEYSKSIEAAEKIFKEYYQTAQEALSYGMEINAGHDLDHENLTIMKDLPGLKEVSIGHRLISHALLVGLPKCIESYLSILSKET